MALTKKFVQMYLFGLWQNIFICCLRVFNNLWNLYELIQLFLLWFSVHCIYARVSAVAFTHESAWVADLVCQDHSLPWYISKYHHGIISDVTLSYSFESMQTPISYFLWNLHYFNHFYVYYYKGDTVLKLWKPAHFDSEFISTIALFPQVPDQHVIYHNTLTPPQINLSSDLNSLIN